MVWYIFIFVLSRRALLYTTHTDERKELTAVLL